MPTNGPVPTTAPTGTATLRVAVWICEDEIRPDTVDFDAVPDIRAPANPACRIATAGEVTLRLRDPKVGGAFDFDYRTAVDSSGEILFTFPATAEGRMVELSVADPFIPTTMMVRLYPGGSDAVRVSIYVAPGHASLAEGLVADATDGSVNRPTEFTIGPIKPIIAVVASATILMLLALPFLRRQSSSQVRDGSAPTRK